MIDVKIPSGVKNIIFDLGGVILNIDYNKTAQAFFDLGIENFDEIYSQKKQSGLFDKLETGNISTQAFVNEILRVSPKGISPKQVIDAWNAMLLDLPSERLIKLKALKKNYRIFLLSNTNEIHLDSFTRAMQKEQGISSFEPFFEKVYYSHKIGLRKPNNDVFAYVLNENKLNAFETLFIDDSAQHIEGAKQLGINTIHYK